MIAITTKSSISVNPCLFLMEREVAGSQKAPLRKAALHAVNENISGIPLFFSRMEFFS